MSTEALRPRNLNVNYLPPPLILSSPPPSPKNVKKQTAKRCIMDNHSGPKRTSSQPPPPPTVVQHRPVIVPDVSSLTTEAPPTMLNLDDNYSSSDEAYIELAGLITAGHSAKRRKKTHKKPIQKASSDGDRSMWHMQGAVSRISQGTKDWKECQIAISFSKWSC